MRASLRNRVGPATRSCSRRRFSATPGVDGVSTLHHARYSGHLNESPRIRPRQSDRTGSRLAYNQPNGSVGRRTRTTPPPIGHALPFRDQGRRLPGCTARHCDAHHTGHWADGGAGRVEESPALPAVGVDAARELIEHLDDAGFSLPAKSRCRPGTASRRTCATSWSACGGRRRTWRRRWHKRESSRAAEDRACSAGGRQQATSQ